MPEFSFHRCDRFRHDTARYNQIEKAEIRIHIKRESVRSNEARDVNPDGGNLRFVRFLICPDAGQPGLRFAGIVKSTQVRIKTSSRRRTNSTAPKVLRLPSGAANPRRSKIGYPTICPGP